jgi:cysteine desulfurase
MAMVELARHEASKSLPLSQIAEAQRLPLPYLEQLFLSLRRAGVVESVRGRAGGYRLSRTPQEITVADVMAAVEEGTHFTRCHDEATGGCLAGERCVTHALWHGLSAVTAGYLQSVTLADVLSGRLSPTAGNVASESVGVRKADAARVYLDYNATAPLRVEARAAMIAALDTTGNPSSVHAEGRHARGIVETAREKVAALIGAKPSEVVFTSGASEANAWAVSQPADTIFYSGIEHDSVLAGVRHSQARLIELPVSRDGMVRIEEVARHWLTRTDLGRRVWVVLQMANNETGAVQPVAEMAEFAREHGLMMHTDAVQAAGRIEIDFAKLPVTTMALSAHKIGGPKGVGALIIRDHVDLEPFIRGGGQERRRRAGTENVAAIAGFGAAAEAAAARLAPVGAIRTLRDGFEAQVKALVPGVQIMAETSQRLPNTSCVAFPGKLADSLLIKLDLAGIAVSSGAACSSGKVGTSHVLAAMGHDAATAANAIRVSLGDETTQADIDVLLAALKKIVGQTALAA